jgi:hypothetical protein
MRLLREQPPPPLPARLLVTAEYFYFHLMVQLAEGSGHWNSTDMSDKSDESTTSSSSNGGSGSLDILISKKESVGTLHDFPLKYHASLILCQSCKLISILAHGTPRWISKFIRLIIFVIVLLPAFVRFAWYYFVFSDRIAIAYKDGPSRTSRHYLDLYGSQPPHTNREGKAVVIFLTGGAWIIGYKMWGALLARALVSVTDFRRIISSCRKVRFLNSKDGSTKSSNLCSFFSVISGRSLHLLMVTHLCSFF